MRWRFGAVLSVALAQLAACTARETAIPDTLPERLTDAEFWALSSRLSEPNGFFHSENVVSNELTYQYVIPTLASPARLHGVYLGVGPEQNFTYIAALEPKIAIIVDVRRQNLIEHLMYKTLFELSTDRADFLSRLFGRARPAGLDTSSTAVALFDAYREAYPDTALFRANLDAMVRQLTVTHRWPLDSTDLGALRHVAAMFFDAGPDIDYNYPNPRYTPSYSGYGGRGGMPTYAKVMIATDSAGVSRGYLGTEALFNAVRGLEARNLLIPVVGDFAGPKALRAVGDYLRAHQATLSAVYVSNVEQYLFRSSDAWRRYYDNLCTIPVSPSTTFIRSINPPPGDSRPRSVRLVSTLFPVEKFLDLYRRGKVRSYMDVSRATW